MYVWGQVGSHAYYPYLGRDEGDSELLMDHESKDFHSSSMTLVRLNGTLGKLSLRIKGVPAKVKSANTEVTNKLNPFVPTHESLPVLVFIPTSDSLK